jgi:hypothetical protein
MILLSLSYYYLYDTITFLFTSDIPPALRDRHPGGGDLPEHIRKMRVSYYCLFLSYVILHMVLTLYSIYKHFYMCATIVDPDHLAHLCHLIWISTGRIL